MAFDFVYINQHLLNNLFYILISIFVFYFIYENVRVLKKIIRYKKTLITVFSSIPMILTMKYPIYIDEYCVHDLRQIPFIIGTLYGGWPVGIALLSILLSGRFYFYGFNLLTTVVYITIFIVAALCSKRFNSLNKMNKLKMSTYITIILAFLTTSIALGLSDFFKVTEAYVFYFILIPPLVVFINIYVIEALVDTIIMRSKITKMEKMEAVSQLAASISHEIRNPLTVIKGFTQLLKSPNLTDDSINMYISHIDREVDSAQSIINEYLAFAKPAPESNEVINVDNELKRVITMLSPLANMKAIQINGELSSAKIQGNVQHFYLCFLNLVKNSIESIPNSGEIIVKSYVNKTTVEITLEDNGVGMSREQIGRFGEPYFSTKENGTGLGSMVAVKTIQTMRGTLNIESTINKGTVFTITFPVLEKQRDGSLASEA